MVAELSHLVPAPDGYKKVVGEVDKFKDSTIAVPALARLLGVKRTTINARFRRAGIPASIVGRTNYIPHDLALNLVRLHQYALQGWPTLHEVSRMTGIKKGTLKARCENGKLEGYVDLTKRLRVNPAEVPNLSLDRRQAILPTLPTPPERTLSRLKIAKPFSGKPTPRAVTPQAASHEPFAISAPARTPFTLPPAPEPRVQVITARDYGLPVRNVAPQVNATQLKRAANKKFRGTLAYNPENPFSISECWVGKAVVYEKYEGTITKLINDPFNPAIQVAMPKHDEPLMREILLRVAR